MIRRKYHRKFAMQLSNNERFHVACSLMNGETPRSISERMRCSLSYISTIKYEFLEVMLVWREGALDKFKGSPDYVRAMKELQRE
jgi:hypothetical protein